MSSQFISKSDLIKELTVPDDDNDTTNDPMWVLRVKENVHVDLHFYPI